MIDSLNVKKQCSSCFTDRGSHLPDATITTATLSVVPTWRQLDLVWLRIELFVFIAAVRDDGVFFGQPATEIDELTTFAAKRHELGIRARPDGLIAGRATR